MCSVGLIINLSGIANFPFDDQVCKIRVRLDGVNLDLKYLIFQFAYWAYDEDKILLNASHKPLIKNYAPNEEWALQVSWSSFLFLNSSQKNENPFHLTSILFYWTIGFP